MINCICPSATPFYQTSTFATLVIGVFAGYIAFRNWQTANEKLRLDLYNRRFAIYQTANAMHDVSMRNYSTDEFYQTLISFKVSVSEADFLFDGDSGVKPTLLSMLKSLKAIYQLKAEQQQSDAELDQLLAADMIKLSRSMAPYLNFHALSDGWFNKTAQLWHWLFW